MNKPVLGLVLGGVLGIFDGLTALLSAPETAPQIASIVIGSTGKGLVTGVLIGLVSRRLNNLALGVILGGAIGLLIAAPIAVMNRFYWQIMLPGTVLGLVVGYATQRYGTRPGVDRDQRPNTASTATRITR